MRVAMTAAKQQLGVEPLVTAKEMSDKAVSHLGVMAYAASFQRASLSEAPLLHRQAPPSSGRDLLNSSFLRPISSSAPPADDMLDVQLEHTHFTEIHPVSDTVSDMAIYMYSMFLPVRQLVEVPVVPLLQLLVILIQF